MSAQHTPGPWSYHYSRSDPSDEWLVGGEGFFPVIAVVIRDEEAASEGATIEANVRLIAAAPEMLVMLERVYQWDPLVPFGGELRDLIAKATGRPA